MNYQVGLLEHCLSAWEDYWFLLSLLIRARERGKSKLTAALANAGLFRTFLLEKSLNAHRNCHLDRSDHSPSSVIDLGPFMPPADLAAEVPGSFAQLPALLTGWSVHSRRIYRMSGELQEVLRGTSLHRMRWQDISLPFPTFGIELEIPFADPDGEKFSLVFLNTTLSPQGEIWTVQSFSDCCAGYLPLSLHVRHQLTKRFAHGRYADVERECVKQFEKFQFIGGYAFSLTPQDRRELVMRTSSRLFAKHPAANAVEQMLRIVVGLTLYLKALPVGTPHLSEWSGRHLPKALDLRAVTSGSQICEVSSIYRLTAEDRALLAGKSPEELSEEQPERALSVHFRSAYWRRARGTGHDPNAPKVEHVRWTIVRLDRIGQNGGLPNGTLQIVGKPSKTETTSLL